MAYMGQTLNSPIINKLASQVKCQEPVKTDQGWESSENAEQKLEAHNRGSFIFLTVLNPGFPVIPYSALPPTIITKQKGLLLGFLGVKGSSGGGSLCYSSNYCLLFWQETPKQIYGFLLLFLNMAPKNQ